VEIRYERGAGGIPISPFLSTSLPLRSVRPSINMRGDVGISRIDAVFASPTSTTTVGSRILSVDFRWCSSFSGTSSAKVSVRLRSAGAASSLITSAEETFSTASRRSSGMSSFGFTCSLSLCSSGAGWGILRGGIERGVGEGVGCAGSVGVLGASCAGWVGSVV
jgi:hypothetical protein